MSNTPLPTAAWFAEHVMGWHAKAWISHGKTLGWVNKADEWQCFQANWNPRANIADAIQMLDHVGITWHIDYDPDPWCERQNQMYQCGIGWNYSKGDTAWWLARGDDNKREHAICRAVEAWKLAQKEQHEC